MDIMTSIYFSDSSHHSVGDKNQKYFHFADNLMICAHPIT